MSSHLNKPQKLISANELKILEDKIADLELKFPVELKFVVQSKHLAPFYGGLRLVVLFLVLVEALAFAFWWPIPSQLVLALLVITVFVPKSFFSYLPLGWLFSYAQERCEELELRATSYFKELKLMETPQRNCLLVVFVPKDKLFYFLPDQELAKLINKSELNQLVNTYSKLLKTSNISDAFSRILESLAELFQNKTGPRDATASTENSISNGIVFY